jgi:hypothetical protein
MIQAIDITGLFFKKDLDLDHIQLGSRMKSEWMSREQETNKGGFLKVDKR